MNAIGAGCETSTRGLRRRSRLVMRALQNVMVLLRSESAAIWHADIRRGRQQKDFTI